MTDNKKEETKKVSEKKSAESANKKETKKTEVSKNVEKLVDEVSKLTVMELSELVNALQDKLGVTAVAPMAVAAAPAAEGASEGGEAESAGGANQTVVITAAGNQKIAVIKAIREIDQNIPLQDAKKMTEELPAEVLKDAKAEVAKEAAEKLKAAGATVELK